MKGLAALNVEGAVATGGFAGHATILLRHVWDRLVGLPLQWISSDLEIQLERVHLAQDAGETARARTMALATRSWLRRAAADLDHRLTLMMGLNLNAASMVVSDAYVRHLAAGTELPPDQRADLLMQLDDADTALAAGNTLADLATASRTVGEIETDAERDQAAALEARVKTAAEASGDEMSTTPMDAVMAQLGAVPHPSVEQKVASITQMLEVWRGRLSVVQDPTARADMSAAIEATEAACKQRDLQAIRSHLRVLESEWQAYLPRHIAVAGATAVVPVCTEWRDRNLQQLTETQNLVRLQGDRPEYLDWDRRLDHARRGLLAVLPSATTTPNECLGPVITSGGEVVAVSREVFTDVIADVPIPPQARLDAAQPRVSRMRSPWPNA
jgi:hypothetical protein